LAGASGICSDPRWTGPATSAGRQSRRSPRTMPRTSLIRTLCALAIGAGGTPAVAAAQVDDNAVTVESLLGRMVDLRHLAEAPAPGERPVQFSSYDRATRLENGQIVQPFANGDRGHYLRVEGEDDRKEFVLAESGGPGYVSRIWS